MGFIKDRISGNRKRAEVRFRRKPLSDEQVERARHRALLGAGPPRIII